MHAIAIAILSICHAGDPHLNGSTYQNMLCTTQNDVSSFQTLNFTVQTSAFTQNKGVRELEE